MATLTALAALELTMRVIDGDFSRAEPLMLLLAGMTEARGDPLKMAIRGEVLRRLYTMTDDCKIHCDAFVGDAELGQGDEVSQTSSSLS